MHETGRERYIITGHDQLRKNRVVHFRRRLEEGQNTLEDLAAADATRDAQAPAPPGTAPTAPRTDPASEQNLIGPRDERVVTTDAEIIPDGTVIVFVKGWELETAQPMGTKKKERA